MSVTLATTVALTLKTVVMKCFRMKAKRQKGGRGRVTDQVCCDAVTVSNKEMW